MLLVVSSRGMPALALLTTWGHLAMNDLPALEMKLQEMLSHSFPTRSVSHSSRQNEPHYFGLIGE